MGTITLPPQSQSRFASCFTWWVLLFVFAVFGVYEQAAAKVHKATSKMEKKIEALEIAICEAETVREELSLQVASQSDPEWIELSIIKGLGAVPEGYTKVFIEESP